jgi:response regulator RpfG family c-di-GMP phosphodiesterase
MAEARQPSVLIVDDERGPRDSLRMILTSNHDVRTAASGSEALAILRSEPVDVVTLDLKMPGLDGRELMRTLHEEFPQTEIIVITGCSSVESATEGIRYGICDYLEKPFDMVQVTTAVTRALSRRRARTGLVTFLEQIGQVVGKDREAQAILAELHRSQKLKDQLGSLLARGGEATPTGDPIRTAGFLEVLAETIEAKDRFMRGHARRVAFYTGLIAERLGLPGEEQEQLRLAAFLHDLGKVGVPTDLLMRPGALDDTERALVEEHPVIGERLIAPLDIPLSIARTLRHHHEWWDGSGYPDGLAGDEIPLTARIVSVADAFDAMSCDRPYRRSLPRDVVTSELERFAGSQFDPAVAREFLAILASCTGDADVTLLAAGAGDPTAIALAS